MTSYLEKILHCPVDVWEYTAPWKLPPAISGNYTLESVIIDG